MEGGRETPARGRRWPRRVAAVALSLFASAVVAEIVARVVFGTPLPEQLPISRIQANEVRGWEMVPGEAHYTYLHRVEVNALGLRGPELPPRRPEGDPGRERRVLALGDSLIYGQGVADRDTLPAWLERALSEADPDRGPWRVVNAGHRAYDTRQELALLEELGPEIAPDVVVVFWYWNDVSERDIPSTCARLEESGPVAFDTGAAMEGWTKTRWHLRQLVRKSALLMTLHDVRQARITAEPVGEGFLDAAMRRLAGYLARFKELAARDGFELVFCLIPDANVLAGPHPSADVAAAAAAEARAAELPVLDLLPSLEPLHEETGELPVIRYDGHYDAEANRRMANAVAEFLLAR